MPEKNPVQTQVADLPDQLLRNLSSTLGVVMDPIDTIKPDKDTTLCLLEAAQRRSWSLLYFEPQSIYLERGRVYAHGQQLSVHLKDTNWYCFDSPVYRIPLGQLNTILMRVDPPVDEQYLTTCQLLEFAQQEGAQVVNAPRSLQTLNEKIFAQQFPQFSPATLVSQNPQELLAFTKQHGQVVMKPLNQMGGIGIAQLSAQSNSAEATLNKATAQGTRHILLQALIENHAYGDKRIVLIDGKPVEKAILRIPPENGFCSNIMAGGTATGAELTEHEYEICASLAPTLVAMDLVLVGIDIIDGYLTEINITSPTCLRELNTLYSMDVGTEVIQAIERRSKKSC